MGKAKSSLIITLVISLFLLWGCAKSEAPNMNVATEQKSESKQMQVQIIEDDGRQFKIKNVGEKAIDALKVTTYPPPLSNNILLVAYSFSKEIGTLDKGSTVAVKRDELQNAKGEILSNSKRKVGAILINGKVDGQANGVMFTVHDGKWIPSSPETKWSAVTEPLLDK